MSHHIERAVEVDSHNGVPLFFAHVEDHAVAEDAGGVDEDIEPAELFYCSADDPRRSAELRDGVVACDGLPAVLLDLADDEVGGCCGRLRTVHTATEVIDDDRGAFFSKELRHAAAYPASSAGYDRHSP